MLKVPFSQKDAAKAMGAKWDPQAKSWYAPAGLSPEDRQALLDRWGENAGDAANPGNPGSRGTVELVNALAEYTANNHGLLPGEVVVDDPARIDIPTVPVKINSVVVEWPLLRRHVAERRGGKCENPSCPSPEKPEKVLVQPLWAYDDELLTQRLEAMAALCPECYRGPGRDPVDKLSDGKVCTDAATSEALNQWIARMAPRNVPIGDPGWVPQWQIDLSLLTNAGFAVSGIHKYRLLIKE